MESRQSKIAGEVDRLITSINRNASQDLREQIQSYSRKVFTSTVRPSTDTQNELREKIISKVSNIQDQSAVLDCQKQTHRFLANNGVYKKAEVLRMLLKLSDLSDSDQNLSNVFKEVKKSRDLNTTAQNTFTANISTVIPIPQTRRSASTEVLKQVRNRGSAQEGISQNNIIRQLSFVFNNTSSNDIVEGGDGYQLRSTINVSDTVRSMISEMADLGWLHKKITRQVKQQGSVRKALRLAVQIQLNQYYRWIGIMENQAKNDMLNLRKLERWSFHPMQTLKWLAIVVQAVEPFDGSHIISIVNNYRPNGLHNIHNLLGRILSQLLQPLLHYIYNWVYMGELLDHTNEFFISENKKASDSEEWTQRFKLVGQQVPNILTRQSAKMIFITGKTIYFLRKHCKTIYDVATPFIDAKNIMNSSIEGLTTLISPSFNAWLNAVHSQVNSVLVNVLINQFFLKYHLQSIKYFFLLGKGDFIQQLYDSLREKLCLKKHQISEHSLDGYISDAITKCFTDYQMPDKISSYRSSVVDRLLAKKIEYGGGSDGWDCFNLQYSLERIQPLQTLLSPDLMMGYQKIFFFLWRVKQIQETLKGIWILHSKDEATKLRIANVEQIRTIFHFSYLLRNMMNHFLTTLHSYLMITIEASWKKFWEQIDTATSFDHILKLHREFQQEILQITLNTPKGKQISQALNNIFSVISNFKTVSLKLQDNFQDYYQQLRRYEERQVMAQRAYIHSQSLEVPEFNSGKLFKDIRELKTCFDTSFRNFFSQLRKEGETKLNILSFNLDYSEYYTNQLLE